MGNNDDDDSLVGCRLTIQVFSASLVITLNIGEYLFLVVGCFTD